MTFIIRSASLNDEEQWRGLWNAYCAFYETSVPEEVTAKLWERFFDPMDDVNGLVAVDEDGNLLGLTHYVLHPHTWSDKTLCYLEDLFVTPEARGKRIGQALIDYLVDLGRENGWRRVYWHTNTDNETARRLYDRFTPADNAVRYTISID